MAVELFFKLVKDSITSASSPKRISDSRWWAEDTSWVSCYIPFYIMNTMARININFQMILLVWSVVVTVMARKLFRSTWFLFWKGLQVFLFEKIRIVSLMWLYYVDGTEMNHQNLVKFVDLSVVYLLNCNL